MEKIRKAFAPIRFVLKAITFPRKKQITELDWYSPVEKVDGALLGELEGRGHGAAAILEPHTSLRDMWSAVVSTFEAKGLTHADALLQARLARILRREDYDRETGEITLWTP